MIDWVPTTPAGDRWLAFRLGAPPGQVYLGYIKKVGPSHYRAVLKHGSMYSSSSMRGAAVWFVEATP